LLGIDLGCRHPPDFLLVGKRASPKGFSMLAAGITLCSKGRLMERISESELLARAKTHFLWFIKILLPIYTAIFAGLILWFLYLLLTVHGPNQTAQYALCVVAILSLIVVTFLGFRWSLRLWRG
jgi:hypothetical protein